ncbi:MAG: serine/threonine-protein kinase [Planctomycetaceae bacterium]
MNEIPTILGEVLELPPPVDREAYLRRRCGEDHELFRRVSQLLEDYEAAGDFLNEPVIANDFTPEVLEGPGTQIGPYKLREQIGEGGMGVVYLAEQLEPIKRRVALKLVKSGMDTRQVLARFEAERQALAMMSHPHISRILDAGATESGRPYFVMELVRGIPITEFCDQQRLSVRQRLELFIQVCQAVQHAHQRGIIHRDLKPSNILVELHDVTPVPKVIDFGIAKATGQQLSERTVYTGFVQMLGTPLYMSPEQATLSGLDIEPARTSIRWASSCMNF